MKFVFLFRTVAGSQQCSMKIYGHQLTQVSPRCWLLAQEAVNWRGGSRRQIEIEFQRQKKASPVANCGVQWAEFDELLLLKFIWLTVIVGFIYRRSCLKRK